MFGFPPEMMQHLMQFIQQQYGPQYAQQFQAMAGQGDTTQQAGQQPMPQTPNYNTPPMERPGMGPGTQAPNSMMSNYSPYNPGGTPMGPNQNTPTPAAAPAPSAWSTALANTPSLFNNSAGIGGQTSAMAPSGAGLSNLGAAPGTQWRGFGAR